MGRPRTPTPCRARRSLREPDSWSGEGAATWRPLLRAQYLRRMDISGASAIVTGGASGLGEATARLLAGRGARVVIADVQDDKGEVIAKEVEGVFAHTDVTS